MRVADLHAHDRRLLRLYRVLGLEVALLDLPGVRQELLVRRVGLRELRLGRRELAAHCRERLGRLRGRRRRRRLLCGKLRARPLEFRVAQRARLLLSCEVRLHARGGSAQHAQHGMHQTAVSRVLDCLRGNAMAA